MGVELQVYKQMPAQTVVVIGASSGGLDALRTIAAALPVDFPAPVAVVLHAAPESPGLLPQILDRAGPLPALTAVTGQRLDPGRIYVAPPDFHLLLEPGRLRITRGPRENRFRPAIDPLFRSAAQVYGPAAIGVILTGNLDDGTAGLWAIKQLGGVAVVQDPADALFPSMPWHAIRHVAVDHVVPLHGIAPLLASLVVKPIAARTTTTPPRHLDLEIRIAAEDDPIPAGVETMGPPSAFACPDCHGVLRETIESGRVRFRCHTGHAHSVESLLAEIGESIEAALWNAIRAMQEGALLLQVLGKHVDAAHPDHDGRWLADRRTELLRRADVLRDMVGSRAHRLTADPHG